MTIYTISFFPKHSNINMLEHERLIHAYGKWLDSMGEENDLYTWSMGKYSINNSPHNWPYWPGNSWANWPCEVGVNIYDEETALAFKLKFGL